MAARLCHVETAIGTEATTGVAATPPSRTVHANEPSGCGARYAASPAGPPRSPFASTVADGCSSAGTAGGSRKAHAWTVNGAEDPPGLRPSAAAGATQPELPPSCIEGAIAATSESVA